MAVIIQEVVGPAPRRPLLPATSPAWPAPTTSIRRGTRSREDGVVELALGLGKTIVDGGACWTYSPAYPRAPPPYNIAAATCSRAPRPTFWAVNMGKPAGVRSDPARPSTWSRRTWPTPRATARLRLVASTYDAGSRPPASRALAGAARGCSTSRRCCSTTRLPLNDAVAAAARRCEARAGTRRWRSSSPSRSIRSAASRRASASCRCGRWWSRDGAVEIATSELRRRGRAASPPSTSSATACDRRHPGRRLRQARALRRRATPGRSPPSSSDEPRTVAAGRPYLLIGFGRWGTSDPWLGIPVDWGQISAPG